MPDPALNVLATSSAQNSSSENSVLRFIDDAALSTDKKITALDRERAKVQVLSRQLDKSLEEKKRLQGELQRTQSQLENQFKQTLHAQKQLQAIHQSYQEQQALGAEQKDKDIEDLINELKQTQADLAKEMSSSKQREAKLQKSVQQCANLEKELIDLKHTKSEEHSNELAVKQLERQRDELLTVVKKQIKLMDILKQQSLHARAATILDITEKQFMQELSK
jgi:hypothetical protein